MTTLITGANGYLASNLYNHIQGPKIKFEGDVRNYREYSNVKTILHFASPSDIYGFQDKEKLVTTILNGTVNILKLAKHTGAKLVFASSMGVININVNDVYISCKLAAEHLIQHTYQNYIILRIPRVYSPCRKGGLMRQLREKIVPSSDKCKYIEFITLDDFIEQTLPILNSTNIVHEYDITQSMTIHDIERWIKQ
jgi:nucleoside-diphosphate-sugar epimerase